MVCNSRNSHWKTCGNQSLDRGWKFMRRHVARKYLFSTQHLGIYHFIGPRRRDGYTLSCSSMQPTGVIARCCHGQHARDAYSFFRSPFVVLFHPLILSFIYTLCFLVLKLNLLNLVLSCFTYSFHSLFLFFFICSCT